MHDGLAPVQIVITNGGRDNVFGCALRVLLDCLGGRQQIGAVGRQRRAFLVCRNAVEDFLESFPRLLVLDAERVHRQRGGSLRVRRLVVLPRLNHVVDRRGRGRRGGPRFLSGPAGPVDGEQESRGVAGRIAINRDLEGEDGSAAPLLAVAPRRTSNLAPFSRLAPSGETLLGCQTR